jgi:ribosome-associated protein
MNKKPKRSYTEKKTNDPAEALINNIIHGIQEKKGRDIVLLDLRSNSSAIADYFIICHGTSNTQVEALSSSVEETVYKKLKELPHHIEGYENAQWVILDYFNVVVHVFLEEKRYFYGIEKLWADAPLRKLANG